MAARKSDSNSAAQQSLKILANCITIYENSAEVLLNQKPLQTLDYSAISERIDKNIVTAHRLADKMRRRKLNLSILTS